jgi:hypothetical protein
MLCLPQTINEAPTLSLILIIFTSTLLTFLTAVGKIPEALNQSPRQDKIPIALASFLPTDHADF